MNNSVLEFNKRYNLTNISDKAFVQVDVQKISEQSLKKPKKQWKQILTRFFTTPWAVAALVVFIAVLLASIILPRISMYSSDKNVFQLATSNAPTDVVINLLGSNRQVERLVTAEFIDRLKSTIGENNFETLVSYPSLNLTLIRYNPWHLVTILDVPSQASVLFTRVEHNSILGTDSLGRDIWTRTWAGTWESILLALLVVTITTIVGTTIGSWIGFRVGTMVDIIFIKFVNMYTSIPTIVWYTLILFILPKSYWSLVAIFLITGWITSMNRSRLYMWRYVNTDFMKVAESIGVSRMGRIFKHALPNFIGVIVLLFVGAIPVVIEQEAVLGFLGFSPIPSRASLGNVLSEMRSTINGGSIDNIWYLLLPTLIIFTITISLRFVAIGISDAFDPKSKLGGR